MRIDRGRSTSVKLAVIAAFALVVCTVSLVGSRQTVDASAMGPSPSHTNAPLEDNCTACHTSFPVNDPDGGGSVAIAGVPATYLPGQQISITVTTSQPGNGIYGFQLTALDQTGVTVGTFTLPDPNPNTGKTQFMNNVVGGNKPRVYVEHTVNGLFDPNVLGSNSWTFTWTAPAQSAGKIDFYASGNGANNDGTNSGDYIYTTSTSTSPAISISGHVFTADLRPLRNTTVILTDPLNVSRTTVTDSFGFYRFDNVTSGQNYTMNVTSKHYRFLTQQVSVGAASLTGVDFTGDE